MVELEDNKIKKIVREAYGKVATRSRGSSCCSPSTNSENLSSSSCGMGTCAPIAIPADKIEDFMKNYSAHLGYTEDDLKSIPKGANLGAGCGNPTAHASIKEGEVVLDLGSGGGIDCFIAANSVGRTGKVIGVDMTPAMIDRARKNSKEGNFDNVEFRLGEIENLPVADNSVDLIMSNCVINLAPDKERVFREAYRVLKPGGRIMVSDIVLLKELPEEIKSNIEAYVSCIGGAILKDKYIEAIEKAGFQEVEILEESNFSTVDFLLNDPNVKELLGDQVKLFNDFTELDVSNTSINVKAIKPLK